LDFGTNYSKQLELVSLRYNNITGYKQAANEHIKVMYVYLSQIMQYDFFVRSIGYLCCCISTDWQIIQCVGR